MNTEQSDQGFSEFNDDWEQEQSDDSITFIGSSDYDDGWRPTEAEIIINHFFQGKLDSMILNDIPLNYNMSSKVIRDAIKERWGIQSYEHIKFIINEDQRINIYMAFDHMAYKTQYFAMFETTMIEED